MRIVCMTNDAQLPMMKNMLNSALKCGFPMHKFHCFIMSSDKEAAVYNSDKFKSITTRKLEVILLNLGMDTILWIDNDIVLFENCLNNILSKPGSFVMQNDGWGHCTGFFLARPSLFTSQIINNSISWLNQRSGSLNDQHAFNHVIKQTPVSVFSLPTDEYPNGDIYFDKKIQSNARMVHCNYLPTTAEKVRRLKEHNMWDESDDGFNLVNKYFI